MLLIRCPYCEMDRPELEFCHAGEAHVARPADPAAVDDAHWAEFLYMRTNPRGLHAERWRHTHGCGRFFNALRDTVSDRFIATYRAGCPKPDMPKPDMPKPNMPKPDSGTNDSQAKVAPPGSHR